LELTSVELGLLHTQVVQFVEVPDGNYQINFNLYSASNTGAPQSLLYSTSFTPYLTAVSTWFTLPISYTLTLRPPTPSGSPHRVSAPTPG